jgi:hypothetical protein
MDKGYEINWSAIGNNLGEHYWKHMETSWEQHGNIVIKEFLSPHRKGKKRWTFLGG